MLAHPGLTLFTGVPAVTLAGQLAPFHRGGWHGLDLADVLIQAAHAMLIDPTKTATNPHGALETLLSQIESIINVVQTPPEPCTRTDCDHGWILVGHDTVTKCPNCPASVRNATVADDEPPF